MRLFGERQRGNEVDADKGQARPRRASRPAIPRTRVGFNAFGATAGRRSVAALGLSPLADECNRAASAGTMVNKTKLSDTTSIILTYGLAPL